MLTTVWCFSVLFVLAACGYLAACAGAERWLNLSDWLGA